MSQLLYNYILELREQTAQMRAELHDLRADLDALRSQKAPTPAPAPRVEPVRSMQGARR